jgi:hypothetical protein
MEAVSHRKTDWFWVRFLEVGGPHQRLTLIVGIGRTMSQVCLADRVQLAVAVMTNDWGFCRTGSNSKRRAIRDGGLILRAARRWDSGDRTIPDLCPAFHRWLPHRERSFVILLSFLVLLGRGPVERVVRFRNDHMSRKKSFPRFGWKNWSDLSQSLLMTTGFRARLVGRRYAYRAILLFLLLLQRDDVVSSFTSCSSAGDLGALSFLFFVVPKLHRFRRCALASALATAQRLPRLRTNAILFRHATDIFRENVVVVDPADLLARAKWESCHTPVFDLRRLRSSRRGLFSVKGTKVFRMVTAFSVVPEGTSRQRCAAESGLVRRAWYL